MLRLIVLCISLSLLICCAKPGTIHDPFKPYKDRIAELESDLADSNNTIEHYKSVNLRVNQDLDSVLSYDGETGRKFDTCSNIMGEVISYAYNNKDISDIDKKRLQFIQVLRDHAFDYTDATEKYKPEYETESGGDGQAYDDEDGEDDYEE